MMKLVLMKSAGLTLSLLMSALVQAQPSSPTLPVHGKGAPLAPSSVTVNPAMGVGTASTASASGYSDPDGDPFVSWQYEWRSGANGTGALLGESPTYTPTNTNTVYVRSRAMSSRGYPVAQQAGEWQEVAFTVGCQRTVTAGGLTYTCPLTKQEADANGVVYDSASEHGGITYILQSWLQANTYCNNLGNGYRLPNMDDFSALYSTYGDMYAFAGWPTTRRYWTSSEMSPGSHIIFSLYGGLGYEGIWGATDNNPLQVSCVRSGS